MTNTSPKTSSPQLSQIDSNLRVNLIHLAVSSLTINLLAMAMPVMMLQAYDRILANFAIGTLTMLVVGVLIAVLLEIALRIARAHLTAWAGAVFEHKTSCRALAHILGGRLQTLERQGSGAYLQKMASIARLRGFYSGQALLTIIDLPFVLIFLLLIGYIAGDLVLIPLALFVLFSLTAWVLGRRLKQEVSEEDLSGKIRYNYLIETLSNIHTLKGLGLEKFFLRRNERLQNRISIAHYHVSLTNNLALNAGMLFSQLMTVAVVAYGAYKVVHGSMGMGGLAACVLLSGRIMQPVQRALSLWTRFQSFFIDRQELKDVFKLPSDERTGQIAPAQNHGRLSLHGVSFGYRSEGQPLLRAIDLDLGPGESVAISGTQGSGKTSLLHLITGMLTPAEGTISVDGVPPHQLAPGLLARHVGYLPEKGAIFYGTILENLTCFGLAPEEDALTAARMLGVDEAVALLPEGYGTHLRDSITDPIPPGLKQCIAIARVLALKPRILLFDNADRGMDKASYNRIFAVLGRLKPRIVLVLVSDDHNILRLADKEYFLHHGALQETMPADSKMFSLLPFRQFKI